jgi:hypothetical protein
MGRTDAEEQDPEKLMALVQEINYLLEAKQQQRVNGKPLPNSRPANGGAGRPVSE